MFSHFKTSVTVFAMFVLAGCSLPRGAALETEIAQANQSEEQGYSVEYVTRDNLKSLASWPETGWHGHYHWLASQSGPGYARIQAGDTVSLTIWDNEVNSLLTSEGQKQTQINDMIVSPSGEIFVPYVGQVRISGMTVADARENVQSQLENFAPSAQLQLTHEPGTNSTVDLVSGVTRPGSYPLESLNVSLLSMIAAGGGISPSLNYPIVQLMREGRTYRIPAKTLLEDASKNVTMRGKDKVIVVDDDRYFIALGATGSERQVFFEQEKLTALEALSILGGLNDSRANLKGVLILREYGRKQLRSDRSGPSEEDTVFVVDLTSADGLFAARNFQIYPGDTVLATESSVTSVQTVFGLIGSAVGLANRLN